jgi:hypothetical protein
MFLKQPALFYLKTILFLAVFLTLGNLNLQAQVTDTLNQKPQLNNGLPPQLAQPPVQMAPPPAIVVDTVRKEKIKIKQEEEPVPLRKKFFTGGTGGLSFGDYTFVQISPILGYRLTERLAVGTGLSYIYVNYPYMEGSILGGKVFSQVMVYKTFFAHGEYELIDFTNNFGVVLVGAGYRQMFSERGGIDLMVLFDVNQNYRSYYDNPVIRTGFIFNF